MRVVLIALAFVLAGCATPRELPKDLQTSSICKSRSLPLRWHRDDTRRSKEQMDSINRQWHKLCRGEK